jgi:hypothetical protein
VREGNIVAFQPSEEASIQVTLTQVQPSQAKSGKPNMRVNTVERGWLTLNGPKTAGLQPGMKVTINNPVQFGQSWYAFLKHVDELAAGQTPSVRLPNLDAPPPPSTVRVDDKGRVAPILDFAKKRPEPEPIPMSRYNLALSEFHAAVAMILEPDAVSPGESGTFLDRSASRTALVNTFAIALTNGRIKLGE